MHLAKTTKHNLMLLLFLKFTLEKLHEINEVQLTKVRVTFIKKALIKKGMTRELAEEPSLKV